MAGIKGLEFVLVDLRSAPLSSVMRADVISVDLDTTLGDALELCANRRIRHLPIVDEEGRLAGLVTDRDLRASISPRIGTISENNAARESLQRHVHVIMTRNLVTGTPTMALSLAAKLMLERRVGCLPVIHPDRSLAGIVTTSDFLRVIAHFQESL